MECHSDSSGSALILLLKIYVTSERYFNFSEDRSSIWKCLGNQAEQYAVVLWTYTTVPHSLIRSIDISYILIANNLSKNKGEDIQEVITSIFLTCILSCLISMKRKKLDYIQCNSKEVQPIPSSQNHCKGSSLILDKKWEVAMLFSAIFWRKGYKSLVIFIEMSYIFKSTRGQNVQNSGQEDG